MKQSGRLSVWKETFRNMEQSSKVVLLCAVLMPCFFWLFLTLYQHYGTMIQTEFCVADGFLLASDPAVFFEGVVLFTVFLNLYLQRNDQNLQYVIRQKDRRQLWCRQIGKTALLSWLMTIYVAICTLCIGFMKSNNEQLVNFSSRNSLMYRSSLRIVEGVHFIPVVVMFCWYSFVTILVMCQVVMLCRWFLQKQLIGWFVIILLGFSETIDLDISLFYNVIDPGYAFWNGKDSSLMTHILYPCLLAIFLFGSGLVAAGRKEYRNAITK